LIVCSKIRSANDEGGREWVWVVDTDSTATAWKAGGVVGDVSIGHDAAFGSLRDGAACNLFFHVPAGVFVDDLGAVEDGFGSDFVGLWRLSARIEEWSTC